MRVAGKVALISGGARGIGAACARLLAREGAAVVLGDVLEKEGRETETEIIEAGGRALFAPLDVTSEEDWGRAVQAAVARYGKLDVLVNNAGISNRRGLGEISIEAWDRVMGVNAKGVFLGTKAAIPEMRKAGGGSIINISSIYGLVGSEGSGAYHASKGAVRLFTKATAIQYAREGIRANSVHPGFVETLLTSQFHDRPGVRENRLSRTPAGRLGVPEDIAPGILYLASDESSFVTGSELVIDGGMTAT
jgi:NAD(P)-dependent dehydrogenase (short-subunit alcohol dehydrogenase family)